jgi:O-antigen/teichoic acid export membrane protein
LANLSGALIPLALNLVTIPLYLRLIGDVRFGILAIVWLLLSYFGIFDLGLSRAASKCIAGLAGSPARDRQSVFWTVISLNVAAGTVGGVILAVAGRYLLHFFNMPEAMRAEVVGALPWLGAAVPVATGVSALIGALEGRERFVLSNTLQSVGAAIFQVVPLGVAYWRGPGLEWLIGSAVLSRVASCALLFIGCWKHVPARGWPRFETRWLRDLLTFGGWVTVSGILTPVLFALDRFLVGATRGAAAITYYTIPFNLASKFTLLPVSVSRTLFPRFVMQERKDAMDLAHEAFLSVAAITTPIAVLAIAGIAPFLRLWLGPSMARLSTGVGEACMVGYWMSGFAVLPSALLQAYNRPDMVAKLHACQVLPFMGLLWLGLRVDGVEGAAWAWTLRVVLDAILLFWAARLTRQFLATVAFPTALLVLCCGCCRIAGDHWIPRLVSATLLFSVSCVWSFRIAPGLLRRLVDQFPGGRLWRARPAAFTVSALEDAELEPFRQLDGSPPTCGERSIDNFGEHLEYPIGKEGYGQAENGPIPYADQGAP